MLPYSVMHARLLLFYSQGEGVILGNQGVTRSLPTAFIMNAPTHCLHYECSGYGMGHAWVTDDGRGLEPTEPLACHLKKIKSKKTCSVFDLLLSCLILRMGGECSNWAHTYHMGLVASKPVFGFPPKQVSNQSPQLQ